MRVAIVGGGVAGLVAAQRLHREHDITLYEAGEAVGGHAHTIPVETRSGTRWIDMGFVTWEPRAYPHFMREVIERHAIPSQLSPASLSVSDGPGAVCWSSTPRGLAARPASLARADTYRMLRDYARFNRLARRAIAAREGATLEAYLEGNGFSRAFRDRLIVPQVATVWTTGPDDVARMPIHFVAELMSRIGLLQHRRRARFRTIPGGSARYVRALTRPFRARIRLRTPVRRVERVSSGVVVEANGQAPERFDAIVLAVHAGDALAMLGDPTPAERSVLGAFRFARNEGVLHTDASLMPSRRRAWASWNYHLDPERSDRPTVTYWMNSVQQLDCEEQFFVTYNRADEIDPNEVIARASFDHAVFDARAVRARSRLGEVSGQNRTYHCGAHWGWGFHECAVESALAATGPLLAEVVEAAAAR